MDRWVGPVSDSEGSSRRTPGGLGWRRRRMKGRRSGMLKVVRTGHRTGPRGVDELRSETENEYDKRQRGE